MSDFKCAIEEANRTGAKRCKGQCPSCKIWWPDEFEALLKTAPSQNRTPEQRVPFRRSRKRRGHRRQPGKMK